MSDPPQQTYTCDTLPAPQNIQVRHPHTFPRSPMARSPSPSSYAYSSHTDSSFSTAFDVPTTEEVIATSHSDSVASSSAYKLDSEIESGLPQPPARKLCVRHQRMADEGSILKLQQSLDALPVEDREAASLIWSTFSSSSHPRRALILHGLLTMCCFSQLSLISEQLAHLIRIDPFSVLPREVCLKILGYLDAISLCRAAQVTKQWRDLADDDVLWRNICEQHIGTKCHKCGWGLPLLEKRRRIHAPLSPPPEKKSSKREFAALHSIGEAPRKRLKVNVSPIASSAFGPKSIQDELSSHDSCDDSLDTKPEATSITRPWKDVYCERLTIERNWRRGRCTVRTLKGHTDGVMCLQFSETLDHPSFPVLITGSYDRTARVWNLETGAEVRCLRGHSRAVRALQFDEAKLVTGSMDHTIRVWNWRTGRCIRILEGHTEGVVCLNFDSNVLASGSVDTTVKIWNFRTGECFTLRGHRDWVNAVQLWDSSDRSDYCATPLFERSATFHASDSASIPTIDTGKMLFSASDDGTIRLWDLNRRSCVRQFIGHVGQVQSMKLLLVDSPCDDDSNSNTDQLPVPPNDVSTPPHNSASAISNSPSTLPSGLPGFSPASVSITTIPPPDHPGFQSAAFIPPTGFDPYAYQMNPSAIPAPQSFVHDINADTFTRATSPNSSRGKTPVLISGSLDNTIRIWDIETGKVISTLFGHIEGVWAVASDKLRLISGSHDRTIKVWVREEGRCMATLIGHRGAVTCLALGDDKIVSGSDDGDIRVWSFGS